MLSDVINNISTLIGIDSAILPNIITFFIVITLLFLSLKGMLSLTALIMVYVISMGILSILGIDSVFNVITLLEDLIDIVIDLVNPF